MKNIKSTRIQQLLKRIVSVLAGAHTADDSQTSDKSEPEKGRSQNEINIGQNTFFFIESKNIVL